MARLTLEQINALIPNDAQILQQNGITQRLADDGSNYVYYDAEGQKVNPGQVQTILDTRDQARQQALTQNGVIQMPSEQGDFSFFNRSNGTNFQNLSQYYNYLYGGGDQIGNVNNQDGSYYVLPEGQSTTDYKNAPLSYNPPPSTGYKLAQMGVLGLAGAGLGGFLPGTESAFGGLGAGAGAAEAGAAGGGALAGGAEGAGLAAGAAEGAAGGGLALGETPWWADLGSIGLGDPLTAAGVGGGATGVGGAAAAGGSAAVGLGGLPTQYGSTIGTLGTAANPGIAPATTATSGTALSRILGGTGTAADYAQVLGNVGAAGLGVAGSNAQANAYSDVADKYLGLGAPFRSKLEASYAPGFNLTTADPAFGGALDTAAQAAARATSARSGNPVDNPGAYAEMQKYILNSSVLPQLNTYRSQLGSFGQLGTNVAGTNDTQAAGQTSGTYNALGYGLGQLTQPQNPFQDAMKGILGGFKLNNSMSF